MHVRSVRNRQRIWAGLALGLAGTLGAAAGHLAAAGPVAACSCATPEWRVLRRAVTSSEPASHHEAFWPAEGTLSSYDGHADIWATGQADGVVTRVGADR